MSADHFVFRCPKCKEYPVTRKTFMRFVRGGLGKRGAAQLARRLQEPDVVGAAFEFNEACPRCSPNGEDFAPEIRILRERKH